MCLRRSAPGADTPQSAFIIRFLLHSPAERGCRRGGTPYSERENAMQQFRIGDAVVESRSGKFLTVRNLGIWVRLEEIWNFLGGEAKINAGIAVEPKRAVDALGRALNAGAKLRRKVLGRAVQ